MRIHRYRKDDYSDPLITTVKKAKKLLKVQGGSAWTEHYERDGTLFEVTPIEPKTNKKLSYNCSYNNHL